MRRGLSAVAGGGFRWTHPPNGVAAGSLEGKIGVMKG